MLQILLMNGIFFISLFLINISSFSEQPWKIFLILSSDAMQFALNESIHEALRHETHEKKSLCQLRHLNNPMRVTTMIANYVSTCASFLLLLFTPPWHSLCRAFTQIHSHINRRHSQRQFSSLDDVNKRCLKPDISHTKHWYVTNHVFLVSSEKKNVNIEREKKECEWAIETWLLLLHFTYVWL